MLSRAALVLLAGVVLLMVAPAGVAWAGGGGAITVTCTASEVTPGCVVGAQTAGSANAVGSGAVVRAQPGAVDAGGNIGPCHDWSGEVASCVDPTFGWMGSDGCYYKADSSWSPPVWDTADQPPPGQAGAFYDVTCSASRSLPGTGGGIVWLPAGAAPDGAPPLPAPVVLARQASSQLTLPTLKIAASPAPDVEQLVLLPTWLWLPAAGWRPVSATAAVPGESVTATATPAQVRWSMGDGSVVVCRGPGTPYPVGADPTAASPTCGHTYQVSSAGQPGGAFPVVATVSWSISWAGGGQTGTLPALTTTATASFRVAETQALDTTTRP